MSDIPTLYGPKFGERVKWKGKTWSVLGTMDCGGQPLVSLVMYRHWPAVNYVVPAEHLRWDEKARVWLDHIVDHGEDPEA